MAILQSQTSHSLIISLTEKLDKYNLPTNHDIYVAQPSKKMCKSLVKEAVIPKFKREIRTQALEYKTLRNISRLRKRTTSSPAVCRENKTSLQIQMHNKDSHSHRHLPILQEKKKNEENWLWHMPPMLQRYRRYWAFYSKLYKSGRNKEKYMKRILTILQDTPPIIGILDSREARKLNPKIRIDSKN